MTAPCNHHFCYEKPFPGMRIPALFYYYAKGFSVG